MAKAHRPKTERLGLNVVSVSDLHCGCRLGLCSEAAPLDDGGEYRPSKFQRKTFEWWSEFWSKWVPQVTKREPWALVVNGDALDGVHHNSVTQISHNMEDQLRIAEAILAPVVRKASAYYHIRGTEAHVGKSGQFVEMLAKRLGAIPNEEGQHARQSLFARVGKHLVHFAHHIGVSSSPFAKSSALQRELTRGYVQSGRWGDEPPVMYVRSHRHVCSEVREPSRDGWTSTVVTPGWQGSTPFTHRLGLSIEMPEFGGILIRSGDEEIFTRAKVWRIERPKEVVI